MKRIYLFFIMTMASAGLFASNGFNVTYTQPASSVHQLTFSLGTYGVNTVNHGGATYSEILFEGTIVTTKKGFAEVPYLNATVMLDPLKNVSLEIIPGSYEEIPLTYPMLPSRGTIYRNQDPATVPYWTDPKSVTDSWYPVSLAENTDPFILRDIRGTSVYVYPFQYNAARNVLRVYKNITVKLVENASPSVNPIAKASTTIVREMDAIYRSVFINYGQANREDLTIGESGDILVVTTSRDEAAIQPYVQWKREKGYDVSVQVVPTGTVVNTTVQNAYNANNNILYVLLVGDWADLQCETSASGRPQDPQVGCVIGTDDFADICVGRFSANSPADVTVQVDKVINYEQLPESGATWYSTAIGIGSDQGPGDDGEYDYQHENVIYNDKLDPFTYTSFTTIYDPGATPTMVTNAVNAGASVINYTGHGSSGSWGTSGFSSTNVAGLTNGNKLPFVMSVACDNGDFDLGTCFAESWLRKSGGGAIMFLGASISQPWDEPMRGQDYFMDVLTGGYDYSAHSGQSGLTTTEGRTTLGACVFNGLTLMCVESGGSGDWETAKTWNIFGDPSVQARTATPAALNLSNTVVMVGVSYTTNVSTSGGPVVNAMVCLSQGDQYFHGITDAGGNVTIDHALEPGTAKLTVTAFNTSTIYEDVNVIPPSGPYISVASVIVDDAAGNGNGQLDYGETAFLTIGLANVGTADAIGVTSELSSTDEFIDITGNSANYGTIPAGDTVFVTDGYQVTADAAIPDQHLTLFNLDATGTSRDTWSSTFALWGHAPILAMAAYTIDDAAGNGNGRLDPGETASLYITAANYGSSDAVDVMGTLSCQSPYVTVLTGASNFYALTSGATSEQIFDVQVDENTPAGTTAIFNITLLGDLGVSGTGTFVEYVGQIPVLIVDWDGNHNSPDAIAQSLTNLEVGFDRVEAIPDNLNLYQSIFICLGVYADNHVMSAEEGQLFADYLNQGGNIFMEGADTWYYDQLTTATPLHPMFNIGGLEDGSGDLSTEVGQAGSIADGMSFAYAGDNSYIDRISCHDPAVLMLVNADPSYGTGVSYDAGTYKTIGFSCEFGGLQDGEKSKDDLMIAMLDFFEIKGLWTDVCENPVAGIEATCYPNPFRDETVIRYYTKEDSRVTVEIYNISGQLINRLSDGYERAGIMHEIRWNGTSYSGSKVADGLYFFRLQAGNKTVTGPIMRTK